MDAAHYSAHARLRDGSPVEVRALRASDSDDMQQALGRMSTESIVRRFFAPRKGFSAQEVARYVEVDFVDQVALVALMEAEGQPRIVGGARYFVLKPGIAEMACAVEDSHQGRGLGKVLLQHLGVLARAAGIRQIRADVLPENQPMLRLLRSSGLVEATAHDEDAVHLTLNLAPARSAP